MATKPGKWEVVGKPSKIPKKKESTNGLKSKKTNVSSMPTIESLGSIEPVQESATIYDAFLEQERQTQPPKKPVETTNTNVKKNNAQVKRKLPSSPKGSKKLQLEDAVKKIEYEMVLAVLEKDQATFPDNPTVWLMDLATYINCNLDNVPEPDPVFSGKPVDYPLSALPTSIQTLLKGVLERCPEKTQKAFMEACIKSMVNDMGKGISTYGFRMVIQLLASLKPQLILTELPKYVALVKEQQSRHGRCLAVLWAAGQGGLHSLHAGLTVWFEVMMPFLNTRSVAGYIVDYLSTLFRVHGSDTNGDVGISCKQFFPLLDLTFNPPSYLSGTLQKKLQSLYPQVKTFSLKKSTNSHRLFFPSFLARLTPSCKPAMKKEICACLVQCLQQEPQCYSVWRQMYVQHQAQSCELVQHMVAQWGSVRGVLDTRLLRETVDTFCRTNQDLQSRGQQHQQLAAACTVIHMNLDLQSRGQQHQQLAACTELQMKMQSKSRSWLVIPVLLVGAFIALLAYDVHLHSSFTNSKTMRYMSDFGVLNVLQNAWTKTNLYTATLTMWLQSNVPQYYAKVAEVVEPYLALFWHKLYALLLYLAEVTAPTRAMLSDLALTYLQWVNAQLPWVGEAARGWAVAAWGHAAHIATLAWHALRHYSLHLAAWLHTHVFTGSLSVENMGAVLGQAVHTTQGYVLAAARYLSSLLSA